MLRPEGFSGHVRRAGPRRTSSGGLGDSRKAVRIELGAHAQPDGIPDRKQHALAFVVASSVLVRLAEVAKCDGTVDGSHDHADRYLGGVAGHHVAAADTAFGTNESGTLEGEQDLLQVGLGQACPLCNVPN